MRWQLLAGATLLVLAAGATTSAMASDHMSGKSGHHDGQVHVRTAAGMHHLGRRHRVAETRGFVGPHQGGWESNGAFGRGAIIDLGPLGFTTACGSYQHRPDYCGPGYSIEAWSR